MSDTPFNAKNGIVANGGFSANSSILKFANTLTSNSTLFSYGNTISSIQLSANSLSLYSSNNYLFLNYDQLASTNNALYIQNVGASFGLYLSSAGANTYILGNLIPNNTIITSGTIDGTIIGGNNTANGNFSTVKVFSNSGGLGAWSNGSIKAGGLSDSSSGVGFFFSGNTGYIQSLNPGNAFLPLTISGSTIRLQGPTTSKGLNIDTYGNAILEANAVVNGTLSTANTSTFNLNVFGNSPIAEQGAHLHWNRTGGLSGTTWLVNQQGLGYQGIYLGDSDTSNNVSISAYISPSNTVIYGNTTINQLTSNNITTGNIFNNGNIVLTANNGAFLFQQVGNFGVGAIGPNRDGSDSSSYFATTATVRSILGTLANQSLAGSVGSVNIPGTSLILKWQSLNVSSGAVTWGYPYGSFPNICVYADGIPIVTTANIFNAALTTSPSTSSASFIFRGTNGSAVINFNGTALLWAVGY